LTSDLVLRISHTASRPAGHKATPIERSASIHIQDRTDELEENPRPYGYRPVKKHKNLFRVHSNDGNYRIIYSILDHVRVVIIVTVRGKKKGTYKDIPTKGLSDKIKLLEAQVKVMVPLIRVLGSQIGIDWVSDLNDNQVRCLEIGIKAIREDRGSASSTAERISEIIRVKEDVQTIAKGLTRLLKEMEKFGAF